MVIDLICVEFIGICYSVCCSFVELGQVGTGGLSVLRTFRLLRILKLVRFMPALRYQLVIMLKTMDNVATFFSLLVLFIFIFRWVQTFSFVTMLWYINEHGTLISVTYHTSQNLSLTHFVFYKRVTAFICCCSQIAKPCLAVQKRTENMYLLRC